MKMNSSLITRSAALSPPTLYITNAVPGFATLWWTPPSGTNWILQERLSPTAGSWTNSPSVWTNPVIVPATSPIRFYRLLNS